MTTPRATTASWLRANSCAITGISMAPSTLTTVGSLTPASAAHLFALSSNASQIVRCQVLATMASRTPDASSTGMSGTPRAGLMRESLPLLAQRSKGTAEFARQVAIEVVESGQVVAHPITLGDQVPDVLRVRPHRKRHPFDDVQPVPVEADALGRVVGEQPHRAHSQVVQDLRAQSVVASVGGQAQLEVRVDGVGAGILELVGLQLVHQPDAAALVAAHVEHHAAAFPGHHRQRRVQLRAAVAAARAEHVAGEAFGVHADQDVVAVADVAAYQGDVLDVVVDAGVSDGMELAVSGRDPRLRNELYVLLVLAPPLDQVGDRDQRQPVLIGEDP